MSKLWSSEHLKQTELMQVFPLSGLLVALIFVVMSLAY
jgi:hypothetical protein